MVNGVKFHTRDLDNRRVTQNSGVCTEGDHEGEMLDFYGHCEWYNTGTNGRRRMIRTDAHCTSIDVTSRWGVFDVPEVGGGESNDNTEDSDAFQQEAIVDVVSINVEDNIIDYCMGDVETKIVLEGGTSRDANQNEEHDIPDDTAQSNCAKGKRSRASVVVDDDYVPPIGDDDNNDESSNSVIHKMAPGRLTRSRGEASIPVIQSTVQSTEKPPKADPPIQSSSSAEAQTTGALTSTTGSASRNTRGTTRGIAVRALVEKNGKLPVRIAAEYDAPVGKNACKLVNQIGLQVRSNLSSYNVKNWKNVDAATRDVVLQNIADQFELLGDSNLVTKTLNTKCGRLLSSSSYKLHQAYKKLVQSHGADYARSHPPKNAKLELWTELIDKRWTNKDWLEKSIKNSENRKKTSGKHRCGTKALAVRVDEETNSNDGQVPELAKIFKDVHFNPNTNMWIHHEDEATYENILKVQEDHCQDPNAIPLTQEEISNLVFKKKSGIVKGLGMRPSSSLVTTASSNSSVEYIQWLENEIIELKEARARDQEERARDQEARARDQEARAKQEEVQKNILNFLRRNGYDDALTYGGDSTSS
ncbi:uncharacterized protein LOC142616658 [Castanea sativa]|uniref:uncharacterized protein LOC142616658 n=1 Tax=Castanea sativa TaxID=21020 RepID=UPI003F64EB02